MKINNYKKFFSSFIFAIFIGALVGTIIWFFNLLLSFIVNTSISIYAFVSLNPIYIPLLFIGLGILTFFSWLIIKNVPKIKGSGIPQTESVAQGFFTFRYIRIWFCTIASSIVSFFGGLSLGGAGPCVQLGGTTANAIARSCRLNSCWDRYFITAGAVAGFGVVFNAPLTAIAFSFEEIHKKFNVMLLWIVSICVAVAFLISRLFCSVFGQNPMIFSLSIPSATIGNIWFVILLGIIIGALAILFCRLLILNKNTLAKKDKIPLFVRLLFAFFLTGIVGLLIIDSLGKGYSIIDKILDLQIGWQMLIVLFFVKSILIVVDFHSNATGGLFFPILCVGAIIGGLMNELFFIMGMDALFSNGIVAIAMCAFMGAVIQIPITSAILLFEISYNPSLFLFGIIACFIAYGIVYLSKTPPLFKALVDYALDTRKKVRKSIVKEFIVENNSFADGEIVSNILLPSNTKIKTITPNNSTEKLNKNNFYRLKTGDKIEIAMTNCEVEFATQLIQDFFKQK